MSVIDLASLRSLRAELMKYAATLDKEITGDIGKFFEIDTDVSLGSITVKMKELKGVLKVYDGVRVKVSKIKTSD